MQSTLSLDILGIPVTCYRNKELQFALHVKHRVTLGVRAYGLLFVLLRDYRKSGTWCRKTAIFIIDNIFVTKRCLRFGVCCIPLMNVRVQYLTFPSKQLLYLMNKSRKENPQKLSNTHDCFQNLELKLWSKID